MLTARAHAQLCSTEQIQVAKKKKERAINANQAAREKCERVHGPASSDFCGVAVASLSNLTSR